MVKLFLKLGHHRLYRAIPEPMTLKPCGGAGLSPCRPTRNIRADAGVGLEKPKHLNSTVTQRIGLGRVGGVALAPQQCSPVQQIARWRATAGSSGPTRNASCWAVVREQVGPGFQRGRAHPGARPVLGPGRFGSRWRCVDPAARQETRASSRQTKPRVAPCSVRPKGDQRRASNSDREARSRGHQNIQNELL